MTDNEEMLERAIAELREPVSIDPALDRRVMAAIAPLPAPGHGFWRSRRWTIRLSPLGGLAAAAALAAVIVTVGLVARGRTPPAVAASESAPAPGHVVMQFVLVAPDAQSVALTGDFNDWSTSATRLARQPGDGVWWVTVALAPGRYRYAFIVDGTVWRPDPNAPAAADDFGRSNSVVTIGGI